MGQRSRNAGDGPEDVERRESRTVHARLPKASDLLAEAIRRRILAEALEPGTALPSEAELIHQSGFARGTVREALRLLETEGLIEIRRGPRGGICVGEADLTHLVRSLTIGLSRIGAPLRDLFEFRQLIEPAAAAKAACKADRWHRERLVAVAEGAKSSGRSHPVGPLIDFHVLVAEATGNEFFRIVSRAVDEVARLHVEGEELTENERRETVRAHCRIAAAIYAGDQIAASTAMLRHLERYEERMAKLGRLDEAAIPRPTSESEVVNELAERLFPSV